MKKIFVSLGVAMLCCIVMLATAQVRTITGKVTDEKGDPVPYASITVKSTKSAVVAQADGTFKVNVKTGDVIIVSAVGLQNKEVTITNNNTVSVSLARVSESLADVVVTTALGIKKQSKELGYSTATISGQDLNNAKVINPVTGLTGKVSGLQVQLSDNSVNPLVRVTLRGNRSILGNNQALVVVDGIQVENNFLARINPNDIESMNVLKGASASALYGSNASNGVLEITTRRGSRNNKPRINFSSTVQSESVSYMPKLQDRFGSYGGEGYNDYLAVHFPNDPVKVYYPYENQSYGPEYNGQMVPLGGPVRIYRADGTYYDSTQMVPYSAVKNGKKNFFDHGMTYQNNISFSAGDATSSVFFSYQNVKVAGVVPGDKSSRNSFRINGSKEYGRFRIDYNTNYTFETIDQAGGSYFQDRPVYWTVINAPQHVDLTKYKDWRNNPFANPNGYYNAYYGNPYWQIDESRQVSKRNYLLASVRLSYNITDWLTASYTAGYSRTDNSFKATKAGFKFDAWAIADPWQAGAIPSSVKLLNPSLSDQVNYVNKINGDALITAKKRFGDFSTKLSVGNSMYKTTTRLMFDATGTLIVPYLYNINYRQGEPTVTENYSEQGLIGLFGDLTIGYKDYLFLHATGRNDWNSKLAPENRSFFYPGVDASFIFTDAIPSLKNNKVLSYGKLRAAWTKVGQVSVGPYALNNLAVVGGGFPYGAQAGFTINDTYSNPSLKPEFTTEKEIGIELGLLNSRINFKATYFDQLTTNQTIPAQISASTGYTSTTVNLGSMSNKGIELDLNLTPLLDLGNFRWNFGANFTYIKNRVGYDLGGEISLGNSVYATPGQAYPYLKETDWNRDPSGRIIVDPNTGFPSKANALVGFGTTVPPYKAGITSSFNYKQFTLNVVVDGRFGAIIDNTIGNNLDFTGISWYSAQTGRMPFVIPNSVIDNGGGKYSPNTNVATIDANWRFWANTWNQAGSNYVNSADFWKLREVSLTYDFSKKFLSRLKFIQAASFTLSGRNLLMFRAKDNVWTDPEFSANDNVNGNAVGLTNIFQTPPTRIFGATLNVTF